MKGRKIPQVIKEEELIKILEKADRAKVICNGKLIRTERTVIVSTHHELVDIKDVEVGPECVWIVTN